MDYLMETRRFSESLQNANDLESLKRAIKDYESRKLRWEHENWRLLSTRVNFLLERVNVTEEKSEDGKRYMKVEFILPKNTINDDNNWRLLLKSKDEDSDGVDDTFDIELQMHRSGSWVTSDIWHG